jgi:flagellar basal-body rod protein FlgB
MSQVQLMSLAIQKADWLATRQSIVAQNVANANTPSYHAKDIVAFESFLDSPQLSMATSNPLHMDVSMTTQDRLRLVEDGKGDRNFSGNTVSLENELMKLGETNSQYSLNTGLIKSFNRMIMSSLKG